MFDSEPPSAAPSATAPTPNDINTVAPALDERERAVLAYALRGDSLKLAAIEMGLSTASVWRLRKCALDKLGFESIFEFLRAHAAAEPLPSSRRVSLREMTRAERDIAEHVIAGHSNASIARKRGTSLRTVANQLAALYRKLHVGSRLELAARLSRHMPYSISAGWQ